MGNMRNTVAYFKKQVDARTAALPLSKTDGYVSIEKPDVTSGELEVLNSELLSGNISLKKPQLGFESASASVVTEIRSHGDVSSPTEPDFGPLFESGIGTPNTSTIEAVEAAPAPSTTEFGIATEGNIKKHDFMIIDNATDGRVPRFVASMKLDVVAAVNDKIDFDDGSVLVATLTAGTYTHGPSSLAGSIGEEIKTRLDAAGSDVHTVAAEEQSAGDWIYTVSSDGGTLEFPLSSGANQATAFMKLNLGFGTADLSAATSYTAASGSWGNRVVLNQAMDNAPTAADVVHATVNYKPLDEGHPYLTAGFYQGNSAVEGYLEQLVGSKVGSLGLSIETGAIAKFNFDLQALFGARDDFAASPYDPDYEDIQGLVAFDVQVWLGSACLDANALEVSVENDISEKQSFKQTDGKIGSIVRTRQISGSVNPFADGSTVYYDAMKALTDYSMMIVIGTKDAGGFVVGRTVGVYLPQVMLSQVKTSDIDDNIIEEINFNAHAGESGTERDIVISFG